MNNTGVFLNFSRLFLLLCFFGCVEMNSDGTGACGSSQELSVAQAVGRADRAQLQSLREPYLLSADVDGDSDPELIALGRCPLISRWDGARYGPFAGLLDDCSMSSANVAGEVLDLDRDGRIETLVTFAENVARVFRRGDNGRWRLLEEQVVPDQPFTRSRASQVVAVPIEEGALILLGWRGSGQFVIRDERAPPQVCGSLLQMSQFEYSVDPARIIGYRLRLSGGLQLHEGIQGMLLRGDILGSAVFGMSHGAHLVALADEHGPTKFFTVSAQGAVVDLVAANRAPNLLTSGMGVVVHDGRIFVSDIDRVLVYKILGQERLDTVRIVLDPTHPVMAQMVPGELWACHFQDWQGDGAPGLLCASRGQTSETDGEGAGVPSTPEWAVLRRQFERAKATESHLPYLAMTGELRHVGGVIQPDDRTDDLFPAPDPAHPGRMLAFWTSLGAAESEPRTDVYRMGPDRSTGSGRHALELRFSGWSVPYGTEVMFRCGGSMQTRVLTRAGAWTHTSFMGFSCPMPMYDSIVIRPPPGSGGTVRDCGGGAMDRVVHIGTHGC